ncbi:SRPBCC family protein [Hansschlegelia zhihuaiae]|uniref:SRPBCC family protein n=1 Tax=Hansschlegelia zhihuaiae TaxID=405005 RepID=A0A4Q0MNK4_9HYPH|nr:SRPBCC family protein [Hansschlegelia zhihuaiae]RXF75115.1 SRPBCC family protein [Hansschlegelia zhihuaiae]
MKLQLLAAAALVLGAAGAADAHGPTRQKTEQKVEINASPDKVWKVVGNWLDMSWLPPVEKTEGDAAAEKGAKRKITLKGGAIVEEELNQYAADKMMYSYRITNVDVKVLPVSNYSSKIIVKGEGDKTTVTWDGAFYRGFPNNDPPPELSDEAALKAVSGLYRAGLDNLKKKVEGGS